MEEVDGCAERRTCPAPLSARPQNRHIASLDGFRGLAVLLVVFFHVAQVSSAQRGPLVDTLGRIRNSGWIGVEMFFTLSGYLITGILLRTVSDRRFFRNFYLRRALRIFPLYYGVLAGLGIVALVAGLHWNGCLPYLLFYVQNFRTAAGPPRLELSNAIHRIHLVPLWTLAVEEQFYLVWPFLVWRSKSGRAFLVLTLGFIVACPLLRIVAWRGGVPFGPLRYWTMFNVDSLVWGGFGAAVGQIAQPATLRWVRQTLLIVGGLLSLGVLALEGGFLVETAPLTIQLFHSAFGAFCCGLILMLAEGNSVASRCFSVGFLRWFGRYSYGIYIFHDLFMGLYEWLRYSVDRLTGSRALGALTLVSSGYLVSAGVAYVSYHLYEKRFLDLKDKIAAYPSMWTGKKVGAGAS